MRKQGGRACAGSIPGHTLGASALGRCFFIVAPTLSTDRLTLRGHTAEDFEASLRLWNRPEVYRHISGKPCPRETGWGRIQRYAGQWALGLPGFWVVEETATGDYVGEMGFGHFWRDIDPPTAGALEAGWVMDPAFFGRGYAHEAMRAAFGWLADARPPEPVLALIAPENAPSLALAARLGFAASHEAVYHDAPTRVLVRGVQHWRAGLS